MLRIISLESQVQELRAALVRVLSDASSVVTTPPVTVVDASPAGVRRGSSAGRNGFPVSSVIVFFFLSVFL